MLIKKVGNRYYRESRLNFRSFPIKREEAEKLLAEGKAELVDKFLHEYTYEDLQQHNTEQKQEPEPEKPSNIISITDRIKAKQETENTNQLITKFKNEYLPYITKEDMQLILNSSKDELGNNLVKLCWKIDLEKKLR